MRRSDAFHTLADWLKSADQIALVCHISPDGDALGSALGLGLALRKLGKRVHVVCEDEVPARYRNLPGVADISPAKDCPGDPDLAVYLDISALDRAGGAQSLLAKAGRSACVDHHIGTQKYAQLTLADPGASATGILVFRLIKLLDVPLDYDMALCIYTAIATDTGNFAHSNTDARTLRLAAKCASFGLPVSELTMRYFSERSRAGIALLGRALEGLAFFEGGAVAVMKLTDGDFAAVSAKPDDDEGFVGFALGIEGVVAAAYLHTRGDGVKCSLRSREGVDVARAARELGGGGHMRAAGVTLAMSMEEAQARVLESLRAQMGDRA